MLLEVINADNQKRLRQGMEKILDMAATGDLAAMSFVFDRIDGRPRQAVEMTGDGSGPVVIHARPMLTKEEWLRAFAPQYAGSIIEGEASEAQTLTPLGNSVPSSGG